MTGMLAPTQRLTFPANLHAHEDLSAITCCGRFLLVAGDEGSTVDVLEPTEDADTYTRVSSIQLLPEGEEADLESLTAIGTSVYAIGSHGMDRKSVDLFDAEDQARTYAKNWKRLAKVEAEASRYHLFRFTLTSQGQLLAPAEQVSLRGAIDQQAILQRFRDLPSKENGIDIEGLADDGTRLFAGFRGPVLRGNFVPVLVFDFDELPTAELRFAHLGGNGIRELCRTEHGFLILGGAVGDGDNPFGVYFWNGLDCLPGIGNAGGFTEHLGTLVTPAKAKAEGLALVAEDAHAFEVVVVFDSLSQGGPARYRIPKLGRAAAQ